MAVARARRVLPFSGWHLLLMPTALLFALPLVWMVLSSFMPAGDINHYPPRFWPSRISFAGYTGLFQDSDILRWLLNTTIVSVIAIVAHLVLCSLAGYGFARLRFVGRGAAFFLIVATIMVPIQLLMIPTFVMFSRLHLTNSLAAAFVPWLASAFGIFLMRQFFLSLPVELEEAALLDGCNRLQVFWRIVLPLAKPALATLAIFTLLGAWNDLIWPLIAINNQDSFTLQLGLANFQGVRRTQWQLLMAGNVVATLPLLIGFVVAQKQFVQTMTFSGLKG
ncbi:carbohydrate ABC transporter permease [Nocardioides mangrovi]|uniref:Carbohydrate ABC transporter permease n=1 Tax=Nocardioides mangrovi TaxID=2874580 RepID=A0ABS7UCK0_9ACTN|nr:carbohydrate ABC transporter permease [Nocardioides mangrovi]MBZ5738724.1 carbohydrate ABC transporter permease [Nocardioides mangrovi]